MLNSFAYIHSLGRLPHRSQAFAPSVLVLLDHFLLYGTRPIGQLSPLRHSSCWITFTFTTLVSLDHFRLYSTHLVGQLSPLQHWAKLALHDKVAASNIISHSTLRLPPNMIICCALALIQ